MKGNEYFSGLEVIFDCSPQTLCLLNEGGQFLKANKFLTNALGYNEEELLSRYFLDFIHPEDRQNASKQFKRLFEHKSITLFKTRFRCANGLYKSFCWDIGQLPDLNFYASATEISHYLNVQNQLAKAKTDYQNLFDNSLDVICLFDIEGRFKRVSKASKTVWGYEEQELLGKKYLDYVHPDDVPLTLNADLEIKSGDNKTNFQNRYIHKNGSVVPTLWSAHYLASEQGMFAVARDASEIEKQKEKIRLNQHRLEALIQGGSDIICVLGADSVYQFVSTSVKQVLHFEPEFYLGKNPFEFIHPDDVSRVMGAFEYVLTTDEQVHISPFRFKNAYGHWCWLDSFATNRINDPAILGVVINARDISIKVKDEQEKQLAAEKLRLSNERYELVAKATKDVIWDWDLENNQMSRNKGFEKILGKVLDNKITILASWEEYIHPDDKEQVLASIIVSTTNPEEQFWQQEYRYIRADGSIAFITDQGYIVRDATKKAIRMVGAMHDNTELKEKELRILEQNKRMHEIAQINSHVIRKPVASILGLISLLDKNAISGEDNLELFEHLLRATQDLDAVIRDINDKTLD